MMRDTLPYPETPGVAFERVRVLQALYPCSVSSGGRDRAHNEDEGGDDDSKHLIEFGCNAWDLVPVHPHDLIPLADAARKAGFLTKIHKGHVHAQGAPISNVRPLSPL